jgi:hypothetical protein
MKHSLNHLNLKLVSKSKPTPNSPPQFLDKLKPRNSTTIQQRTSNETQTLKINLPFPSHRRSTKYIYPKHKADPAERWKMIFKYKEAPIHGNQQKAVTFSVFSSRNYAWRGRRRRRRDFHFFILKFDKAQKSSEKEKEMKTRNEFHIEIK